MLETIKNGYTDILSTFGEQGILPAELEDIVGGVVLNYALASLYGSQSIASLDEENEIERYFNLASPGHAADFLHAAATIWYMRHANNANSPFSVMSHAHAPYLYSISMLKIFAELNQQGFTTIVQLGCSGPESLRQMREIANASHLDAFLWDRRNVLGAESIANNFQLTDFFIRNSELFKSQRNTIFVGENVFRPENSMLINEQLFVENLINALNADNIVLFYDWSEKNLRILMELLKLFWSATENSHPLNITIEKIMAASKLGMDLALKNEPITELSPSDREKFQPHYMLTASK